MRLKELSKDNEDMYFLFPAGNLKDLTQEMIFDPFGLKDKVVCLPMSNFPQAFYLMTGNYHISEDDWKMSESHGKDLISDIMRELNEKTKGMSL